MDSINLPRKPTARVVCWRGGSSNKGVRFVGVYLKGQPWDTHADNANATKKVAGEIDQPSAALVRDLKARGLLDSTLVVWMGEFGRTPVSQGANGRDHSRRGFSLWLAGGGIRGGYSHGATDEFGYESVEQIVTMHDLHATLLDAAGPGPSSSDLRPRRPPRTPDRSRAHPGSGRPGIVSVAPVTSNRTYPSDRSHRSSHTSHRLSNDVTPSRPATSALFGR